MFPAVDDVHHRDRQDAGRGAADIAEQRLRREIGGGFCNGKAHTQNGVCPKAALVVGAVEFDHRHVDADLFGGIHADDFIGDLSVHGGDRFENTFAHVAALVAIPLFNGLVCAGGCARWHGGAADGAVFQKDVDFDRGVAPAVEDFAGVDVDDGAHCALVLMKLQLRGGIAGTDAK